MQNIGPPLTEGFLTGASLIIAIGAQNAFVLKQGIRKNHIFITALFCAAADSLLISLGVGGLGELFAENFYLLMAAKWGGLLFCFGMEPALFFPFFRKNLFECKIL